jgi:hypothetical protein
MSNGIIVYSANNTVNADSTKMNGIFYRDNGIYLNTANIPSTGFQLLFSIATPVEEPDYLWTGTLGSYSISISASGQAFQTQFVGPVAFENADNCNKYPPSITNIATQVYSFGTPVINTNDYGFYARGANSFSVLVQPLTISQDRKAYYLHPDSNGQALRSASATSIPSSYGTSIASYSQPNQLVGSTIFFDRTFLNPPLIFITQSSGPIALHYMTRDGNGRYNGMTVVAASTLSTQGLAGTSAYTPNTYTYTYFLVSDEVPNNVSPSNNGLKVFNQFSETIYDSSYFTPTFRNITAGNPQFAVRGFYRLPSCSSVGSVGYLNYRSQQFTLNAFEGICLNNLNSITGHTAYTSFVRQGDSSAGPTTFWGDYVHVVGTAVDCRGLGTNGIFMEPSEIRPGWANSWSYRDLSLTNYLFANYSY